MNIIYRINQANTVDWVYTNVKDDNKLNVLGYIPTPHVKASFSLDAKNETWMWSVGRRISDNVLIASTTTDLFQNPEYECLWLR